MTRTWPAALLALLALLAGAFLVLRPLDYLTSKVPPIETLVVDLLRHSEEAADIGQVGYEMALLVDRVGRTVEAQARVGTGG